MLYVRIHWFYWFSRCHRGQKNTRELRVTVKQYDHSLLLKNTLQCINTRCLCWCASQTLKKDVKTKNITSWDQCILKTGFCDFYKRTVERKVAASATSEPPGRRNFYHLILIPPELTWKSFHCSSYQIVPWPENPYSPTVWKSDNRRVTIIMKFHWMQTVEKALNVILSKDWNSGDIIIVQHRETCI